MVKVFVGVDDDYFLIANKMFTKSLQIADTEAGIYQHGLFRSLNQIMPHVAAVSHQPFREDAVKVIPELIYFSIRIYFREEHAEVAFSENFEE